MLISNSLFAQRTLQGINTGWKFFKGDIQGFPANTISGVNWEDVSIPHTWNTADVLDDEKGYYRGTGWYTRKIYVPADWKQKEVSVYFEGASQVTDVFVNGRKAGSHIGGYAAFSVPVTQFLKFGESGLQENVLQVRVDNSHNAAIPPLSADFTFFGGIYRDVYLLTTDKVHFDTDNYASAGVFLSTPKVSANSAGLIVRGGFINQSSDVVSVKVGSKLIDAEGKVLALKEDKFRVVPKRKFSFAQAFSDLKSPNLWSPENPYLYRVVSTITDARTGRVLDELSNPLGFRWFSFDPEKGFFLNGKPYKLIGASRHQDYKDISNALPDAMHVRDVELLKEMGANFLRVAHYPQDPAVLQACDRLGLLASVEIPIVNQITESEAFAANCKMMQVEMIRQNFNHPSVIIWAYMNEILLRLPYQKNSPLLEPYLKNVAKLAEELEEITRREDPSRQTMIPNNGNFDLYHKAGLTQIPGIVGWNLYQGWYSGDLAGFAKFLDQHHKELPHKPLLVTEYGADADYRLHTLQPLRFDKSNQYSLIYHQAYLKAIQERPFVLGGAIWNLADFNSEPRAEATPHINTKGILTIDRKEKDMYLFYQANLKNEPFLRIGSRGWTLRSGMEDKPDALYSTQPVEVFSNQKSVVLRLNGKVIGTQPTRQGVAQFQVPFIQGTNRLEAESAESALAADACNIEFKLVPQNLRSLKLPFRELNISLGDKRFFVDEKLNQVWLPEKPYTPGTWGYIGGEVFSMKNNQRMSYGSDKDILGTEYDAMYETQRVGIEQFKLDVPPGRYEIILHFAELLSDKKPEELVYNLGNGAAKPEQMNKRVFDVYVNGNELLRSFGNDNYLEPGRAYASKTTVLVEGVEGITITFRPKEGSAILSGVQIRKMY